MGKTRNSGLSIGIGSSPQGNVIQSDFENKIKELIVEHDMVKPLIDAGVKFNKEDVLFVTKDKGNHLIWLEKGNDYAGLNHILKRHSADFLKMHEVSKENITSHINEIVTNGNIEYSRVVKRNNREGIERLYVHNGKYYLLTGIGTNGFMVSAYPIDESEANRLKARYKND